jgi:CDP-glycerol glycerophosphotransferase (TagB/SpsB family)
MTDHLQITDENILKPTKEVIASYLHSPESGVTPTLIESLDVLFPEQKREEKKLRTLKEVLGSVSDGMSEEQIHQLACKIQFLVESWLDDYERKIFKGSTLNELLHEKGGI